MLGGVYLGGQALAGALLPAGSGARPGRIYQASGRGSVIGGASGPGPRIYQVATGGTMVATTTPPTTED